jgi:hypothetical protein
LVSGAENSSGMRSKRVIESKNEPLKGKNIQRGDFDLRSTSMAISTPIKTAITGRANSAERIIAQK